MENFTVYNGEVDELPVVIDLPHSGTFIPEDIKSKMVPDLICPNVDWFLPELYDFCHRVDSQYFKIIFIAILLILIVICR
ncbi:N-formylglutamate amidohydrolase [Companilactobacillus farciminis]|nr:N-formylglutamate amidohydrolase [Companilactobacillus farciminis]